VKVAIARAKNTEIFQKWEKLAPGDELKHGGRTFIKDRVNVVVGTLLTDEDRLIERINQLYASQPGCDKTARPKPVHYDV
jgi:hypothetical protein